MKEGWRWRLLALTAVIGAIVVVLLIVEDGSISTTEAEDAIEALPYRVKIKETKDHVLVGTARGRHGAPVHFAVARSIEADGIPAHLHRADRNVTGGGGFLVWGDGEYSAPGESVAGAEERGKIEVAIEEALCRKATGDACPV